MNESQLSRADARDRGLRRASHTTGVLAAGGVAATVLAAVVFAHTATGTDAAAAVSADPPVAGAQATQAPSGPAAGDAPAPARHTRSTRHTPGGSSTQGLQPPATPVAPSVAHRSHVTSGAS